MAHLDGKVGKGIFARPCINKAQLFQYREGLIVSSACLGGEIPQAILNDDLSAARTVASWYRDVFGDDFYLEIQDHGSEEDKKVNPAMIQLSEELGIRVIATNDSHFTSCLDAEAHDALICIQTGKLLTDDNRLHYAGNEYFKSVNEMRECFADHLPIEAVDQALYNTLNVAKKVDTYDLFGATRIPDFPVPTKYDGSTDQYLRDVSQESLMERLKARMQAGLVKRDSEEHYFDILHHELDVICEMGFSSYFLVVWDYIRHAKELKIPVGPGRGSAAGSLVAFALRITDVDPVQFNLLFERFLNPERRSMPDIDTDFSVKGRERIINYVSERYGADRVAQIITFNRLTSKAVLKDVARVHSVPYSEADRLAKLIPVVRGKPATLTALLSDDTPSPDFKKAITSNPPYRNWLEKAKRIEGANKTYGIHAAGVVISASPLTDIVPLSKAKHGETITQYAMEDVEALGLLKMDFLGLKNLTVIETALEFINDGRKHSGVHDELEFSVDSLPLDDEKTYKLLAEGELDGIFQLDASRGMRNIVRELRPSSLEDISSILALYRPGPLDAGLIPKFIRRKHGVDPIEYDHPLLEPILKETYGIMVYQEQIMRIARDLAGYSLGQADILRRAMGKKKTKDMELEKPRFVVGAKRQGISEEKAIELFDMMIKFAEYCFNKSHSTAYAYLTYQTAYLKANYPVEYSAALLCSNMSQSDKLTRYLADANSLGVRVLPPSVNKSNLGFTVDRTSDKNAVVLFGLEAVKTVGASVSEALIAEREANGPFQSIMEFVERVNLRVLNKRAVAALIQAGAFDELHSNRKVLLSSFDSILALRRKLRDRRKRQESKGLSDEDATKLDESERLAWEDAEIQLARDSETEADFTALERLAGEKASIGFYASGHPLYELQHIARALGCTSVDSIVGTDNDGDKREPMDEPMFGESIADGSGVMILSCITDLKKMKTARGKNMAKWTIEDSSNRIPGIVFPNSFDIVEQESHHSTDPMENIRDEKTNSPDEIPESRLVVEQDARVVVWGKVDRESSGVSQIVIDDVQRVEQVRAVVATAKHDAKRPPSVQLHILRNVAAKILGVDLDGPKQAVYRDANGEFKKRRWTKVKPLAERNRIPLILHCLEENGNFGSAFYAGNTVRMPAECQHIMHTLEQKTGFEFVEVSVAEDIMAGNVFDEQKFLKVDLACSNRDAKTRLEVSYKSVVNQHEEIAPNLEVATKVETSSDDLLLHSGPSQFTIQSVSRSTDDDCDGKADQDTHEVATLTNQVTDADQGDVQEFRLIDVEGVLLTEDEHAQYEFEYRQLTSRGEQRERSRVEAALHALRNPPFHRDSFFNGTFRKPPSLHALSVHDDFVTWEDDFSSVSSRSFPEVTGSKPMLSSDLEMRREQSSSCLATSTPDQVRSLESPSASQMLIDSSDTGVGVGRGGGFSTSDIEGLNNAMMNTYADTPEDDREYGSQVEKRIDFPAEVSHSNGRSGLESEHDSLASPDGNAGDTIVPSQGVEPEECIDLTDGLKVDFDSVRAAGVLDAICLVAGDAVEKHSECHAAMCAMTQVDLAKLVETNVSLKITASVVTTAASLLYVLVDIRESIPTGKRKRVRSFGPVVVVFRGNEKLRPLALTTKKAQRRVASVVERLSKASVCETSADSPDGKAIEEQRLQKKSILSSKTGFVFAERWSNICKGYPRIGDGGQILRYMSRAAEYCVSRAIGAAPDLRILKLVSFVCEDSTILKEPVKTLRIRAHMDGKSFVGIRIQVQGNISTQDQRSSNLLATFVVTDDDPKRLRSFRVTVDEEPLFLGSVVEEQFSKYISHISEASDS